MSLRRRLLLTLLVCAPLIWALALGTSIVRATDEVNELFDTEMIHLARQVMGVIDADRTGGRIAHVPPIGDAGDSKVGELAITVRDRDGRVITSDRIGVELPAAPHRTGFVGLKLDGEDWNIYYLTASDDSVQVAVGQEAEERDELVLDLTLSQLVPWLLALPVLLGLMAWAVRVGFAPMVQLTEEVGRRHADDLQPLVVERAPTELKPLVEAMNRLFTRIADTLAHERRFTADAAHELRTPLAVLRAQWDVLRREQDPARRLAAEDKVARGLERLERLVTQMLSLSRVDAADPSALVRVPVDWPAIVEQVMTDCLALAERRRVELACDWPAHGAPLPLDGDASLLAVMLRNLMDNAVRYADAGTSVVLRFEPDRIEIDNDTTALDTQMLDRLGERFHRPPGQGETGSGLGLSIALRVAALHGLSVALANRPGGVRATIRPAPVARPLHARAPVDTAAEPGREPADRSSG